MPIDAAPVTTSPRGEATAQFFYEWSKATGRLALVGATADSRDKGTSVAASFPQSMEKVHGLRNAATLEARTKADDQGTHCPLNVTPSRARAALSHLHRHTVQLGLSSAQHGRQKMATDTDRMPNLRALLHQFIGHQEPTFYYTHIALQRHPSDQVMAPQGSCDSRCYVLPEDEMMAPIIMDRSGQSLTARQTETATDCTPRQLSRDDSSEGGVPQEVHRKTPEEQPRSSQLTRRHLTRAGWKLHIITIRLSCNIPATVPLSQMTRRRLLAAASATTAPMHNMVAPTSSLADLPSTAAV